MKHHSQTREVIYDVVKFMENEPIRGHLQWLFSRLIKEHLNTTFSAVY
jgi:hypothetical protein